MVGGKAMTEGDVDTRLARLETQLALVLVWIPIVIAAVLGWLMYYQTDSVIMGFIAGAAAWLISSWYMSRDFRKIEKGPRFKFKLGDRVSLSDRLRTDSGTVT